VPFDLCLPLDDACCRGVQRSLNEAEGGVSKARMDLVGLKITARVGWIAL